MQLLHEIATWLTAAIGVLVLLSIALWLVDKVVTEILKWFKFWDLFVDFCFKRQNCRCGAVWPKHKADPE